MDADTGSGRNSIHGSVEKSEIQVQGSAEPVSGNLSPAPPSFQKSLLTGQLFARFTAHYLSGSVLTLICTIELLF